MRDDFRIEPACRKAVGLPSDELLNMSLRDLVRLCLDRGIEVDIRIELDGPRLGVRLERRYKDGLQHHP